jgi:hypothetical protein
VIALGLVTLLAGCGHRELKAPCAPLEGASLASAYAGFADDGVLALMPVDDILPSAPSGFGPIPVSDPCGPLKPLNAALVPPTAPRAGAPR